VSEPDYFLPFTPNGRTTELTAIRVKQKLGLGAYAGVDPIRESIQSVFFHGFPDVSWRRPPSRAFRIMSAKRCSAMR
jgi:hypothetical protein